MPQSYSPWPSADPETIEVKGQRPASPLPRSWLVNNSQDPRARKMWEDHLAESAALKANAETPAQEAQDFGTPGRALAVPPNRPQYTGPAYYIGRDSQGKHLWLSPEDVAQFAMKTEGLSSTPYQENLRHDPWHSGQDIPTEGFGHTRGVQPGSKPLHIGDVFHNLYQDFQGALNEARQHVGEDKWSKLTVGQRLALGDVTFNDGSLTEPHERIRSGEPVDQVFDDLPSMGITARGGGWAVQPGLINRRREEQTIAGQPDKNWGLEPGPYGAVDPSPPPPYMPPKHVIPRNELIGWNDDSPQISPPPKDWVNSRSMLNQDLSTTLGTTGQNLGNDIHVASDVLGYGINRAANAINPPDRWQPMYSQGDGRYSADIPRDVRNQVPYEGAGNLLTESLRRGFGGVIPMEADPDAAPVGGGLIPWSQAFRRYGGNQ